MWYNGFVINEEMKMFAIEINENATCNLIDQNGNILLDSATTDEIDKYLDELISELENLKFN